MAHPLGPLLLLLSPALAFAQADANRHVDDVFGFAITRPSAGWVLVPKGDTRSVDFQMVLTEPEPLARVSVRGWRETTPSDPNGTREKKRGPIERQPGVSELVDLDLEVAGRVVPGLALVVEANGVSYRFRQFYLAAEGRRFELEDVVVLDHADELASVIDAIWKTFELREPAGLPAEEQLLLELAAKCGSEVDLAKDWRDASARARREGKLVAVAVHLLPGFDIENPWPAGAFMDPDLIDLLDTRYVPLLFQRGWNAPFEAQSSSYGMGPYSFGNTLLLVTAGGEVVAEGIPPYDDFLRANLASTGGGELPEELEAGDALEKAEALIERGELERARELLSGTRVARGHLLLARIGRRERDLEEWAGAIRVAGEAEDAAEHSVEIGMARAELDLAQGRLTEAKVFYTSLLEEHPDSEHAPEAAWHLGRVEYEELGSAAAKARWLALVESHPESRWAWAAAQMLRSQAFAADLLGSIEWPDLKAFDAFLHPAAAPVELGDAARAFEDAIAFLLASQYTDGSWLSPMETGRSFELYPKHLTEAVTAICARTLLSYRDRPEVARAIERALDHLIERLEYDLSHELRVVYMDYAVWNRASQIYLLAKCLLEGFGDRERLEKALDGALRDLRARQHQRGGWSYYVSGDLDGGKAQITQSISFTTAYAVLALAEARDAGAELPEGLAPDAIGCLARMRNDNGTYVYMMHHADESVRSLTEWEGSAGRGPLCALALLRHGRSDLDEVRANLEKFVEYRGGLTRQVGRALMHAGPYAEGSHWVLFDYATAAAAVAELPEPERAKYRELLLADLLACRRADGSYVDNPLLGRAMGAGMALWAFERLGVGAKQ